VNATLVRRLTIVGALLVVATLPASPSQAADDELGGYSVSASGFALSIAPTLPSVLPADVPVEGTLSLAAADLSSGGRGFGRASTVFPGTLTTGLRPLLLQAGVDVPIPDYPLVIEQREFEDAKHSDVPGLTMATDVKPNKATVTAGTGGFSVPAIIDVGSVRTVSKSEIAGTTVTASSDTVIEGLDVLAGALHISSIESVATATSDASAGGCGGSLTVSGVTIGGQAAIVDEKGLHLAGQPLIPGIDLNPTIAGLLATTGIEIRVLPSIEDCDSPDASRSTGGLLIAVPLPAAGPLPPGGKVSIVLASTAASASATPPFTLDTSVPPDTSGSGAVPSFGSTPTDGFVPGSNATPTGSPPPAAIGPATPAADGPAFETAFGGVPVALAAGLLFLAVPLSRRIRRYLDRVMALSP
jgi:hypothetical protein